MASMKGEGKKRERREKERELMQRSREQNRQEQSRRSRESKEQSEARLRKIGYIIIAASGESAEVILAKQQTKLRRNSRSKQT